MRHFFLSLLFLFGSASASGQDFPNNAVITSQSNPVIIYEVRTAEISHDASEVNEGDGFRVIRISAALQIDLNVEGNICGSKPESVSVRAVEVAGQTQLSLQYIRATNPFLDELVGCAAYSVPRTITVALRINDFAESHFEKIYSLTLGLYGQEVLIKVRYEDNVGLIATIVR